MNRRVPLSEAPGRLPDAPPIARTLLDEMAGLAWDAYAALLRAEKLESDLRTNGYWQALKDSAFARFLSLYEHRRIA